jgi:hypothetical protein
MPDSLSHKSRDGTACASCSRVHIPPRRSGVVRDGSIRAWMKPENAEVITSTGGVSVCPSPTGSGSCGNQRSHWTWNPGSCTKRSAGSGAAYSGRIAATFARNSDAEPDQPTRSASVAAGIVGVFTNSSRTLGANASKLDTPDAR